MFSRSVFRAARSSPSAVRLASSSAASIVRSSAPLSRTAFVANRSSIYPQSLSRWYSDASDKKPADGAQDAATKQGETTGGSAEIDALKKDVEAKKKEIAELKDNYLRSVADYRNLQDRTKREAQAARDFALQGFVKDLLSSIDNLEHALLSVPAAKLATPPEADLQTVHQDLVSLHKGLQMIETVLLNTLTKHGITRFDPAAASEAFDPNKHEAVFQSPMPGKENNTVFHTQQKGFLLNGRVLRAAQVGVVNNP